MKGRTVEDFKARFKQLGYVWPAGVHLIGVRNPNHVEDVFDDALIQVRDGRVTVAGIGTTVPGSYWLTNLMNPKGAGVLKAGQYVDCYSIGLHHNEYQALVQVKPVTVYRDINKDLHVDEIAGTEDTGLFGLNIHHASIKWISKIIGKWSAACQVWASPSDFDVMLKNCIESKQKFFTYTLLKDW